MFRVSEPDYEPNTVVGNGTVGLWTMQWTHIPTGDSPTPSPQEIVGINPDTGAERVVATLPARAVPLTEELSGLVDGQAVVLDGALFLLEPPYRLNGYQGYSFLVRVSLPLP